MRVGTVFSAKENNNARKPSYILKIDYGKIGMKKSSAQISKLYSINKLLGMQVVAVVNIPAKQIANTISECLVLGVVKDCEVVLLQPERNTVNGLLIC